MIWRAHNSERVAGVEAFVIEIKARPAVKLVRARLGINLNPAPAWIFILCRIRILIDAYFTDCFLGRNLAVRKAIDFHLRTILTLGWAGQRLQRRGECFGLVGQGLQLPFAKNHSVGISVGIGANSFVIDGDRLFQGPNSELQIESQGLA